MLKFVLTIVGNLNPCPLMGILFFASDRDGGYGGIDIYKITKNYLGFWGEPVNLGPNINSPNNEKSPFLHPDGKTLYFASDNFPSLGGMIYLFLKKIH